MLAGGRLRFTADGKTLVAGGMGPNHGLVVWDWQTSKEMRGGYPKGAKKFLHMLDQRDEEGRKAWHFGYLADFSMSDDGKTIAYVTGSGKVNLWELISPEPPPKKGHSTSSRGSLRSFMSTSPRCWCGRARSAARRRVSISRSRR